MIIHLNHTNAGAISSTIRKARRSSGTASGLVFTLVVMVSARRYEEALEAALQAGREHPSRIILVVKGTGRTSKLDADIHFGEDAPGDVITLRMGGEVAEHADSVVLPLLLPDSPVVAWWPNESPVDPADDPIGRLAKRRITDASGVTHSLQALRLRAEHHAIGDTDLTWTRLTVWRALLAAALDQYPARISSAKVEADRDNAPAELLASWLESRLHVPVVRTTNDGPGITAVRLTTAAGDIAIIRTDGLLATYEVPGQPRRKVALKRRSLTELISEELRRLDADDIFEAAAATLVKRWDNPDRTKPKKARA
ncbi:MULTISPECIES: glucose-6-phosphate dehydrogenase assembly protein OpcA [Aestuariimicrobium]|uniref:glucose-6-phosphate dehydrogenase assembly protein OpcA n=1 Tax=Aestuariimicrobium TaxID=396388 RepID=UPI0003B78FE9|nr:MULTISPECIES: glucose-6-phosphate dehydrogenase assembly protein OpcA [Aestuariimicrobium]CAI9399194.1 hypothetical protein AESSP_00143 [Aestuariimicrobium sp. T2.26MG-19.2B]